MCLRSRFLGNQTNHKLRFPNNRFPRWQFHTAQDRVSVQKALQLYFCSKTGINFVTEAFKCSILESYVSEWKYYGIECTFLAPIVAVWKIFIVEIATIRTEKVGITKSGGCLRKYVYFQLYFTVLKCIWLHPAIQQDHQSFVSNHGESFWRNHLCVFVKPSQKGLIESYCVESFYRDMTVSESRLQN